MLEIHYVWQWPLRICHWVNALCVVVLSVTGYYIGDPFSIISTPTPYVMGTVRFVHFLFGYVLLISLLVRILWMFIGNQYASWRAFLPWLTPGGRRGFIKMLRYYTFTGKQITYEIGHNPVAATAYIGIFALFLIQVLSGFALYGQYAPGGLWDSAVGWLLPLVGNQELRLVHHVVMWLLAGFIINHIYSSWLMDIKERNGTISGIFSGYKYIEPRDIDT